MKPCDVAFKRKLNEYGINREDTLLWLSEVGWEEQSACTTEWFHEPNIMFLFYVLCTFPWNIIEISPFLPLLDIYKADG